MPVRSGTTPRTAERRAARARVRTSHDAVVVVPMYREATVVATTVRDLLARFDRVVCVDDGSPDDSAAVAEAAGAIVVRHPLNLGQGAALATGIRYAVDELRAAYVVTFDADGQHDAGDAAAMVDRAARDDLQVVLGSRFLEHGSRAGVPRARRLVLAAAVRFTHATCGLTVTDAHNGLRVLRADAAAALQVRLHGMAHASEILTTIGRQGWTWAEHPVSVTYTEYSVAKGQRGYNAFNILFDLALARARAAS